MPAARYNPQSRRWEWPARFAAAWRVAMAQRPGTLAKALAGGARPAGTLALALSGMADSGWRTIHGVHVHIGADGKIDKGPAKFVGTNPSEHGHDGRPDGTKVRPNTTTVTGDNFTHTTHDGRKVKGYIDGGDWVAYDVDGQHPGKEQDELSRAAKTAERVDAEPERPAMKPAAKKTETAIPSPAKPKPSPKLAKRSLEVPADEKVYAGSVQPPHEVTEPKKFQAIVDDLRENGWRGRPVLVEDNGDGYQALTGSHRVAAARDARVDVPVVKVDAKKLARYVAKEGLPGHTLTDFVKQSGGVDDDVYLHHLKKFDPRAANLMKMEIEENRRADS